MLKISTTFAVTCLFSLLCLPAQAASGYTQRIIIKFKETEKTSITAAMLESKARSIKETALRYKHKLGNGAGVYYLDNLKPEAEARRIAAELMQRDDVEYAEPDVRRYPAFVPNDTQYSAQWYLHGPENGEDGGIRAEQAWDTLIDDSGVVIAVIDSGILEHADITRVLSGYDFISADGPGVFFTANDGNGRDADPTDPGDATSMGECGDGAPEDDQDSSWHGTLVTGLLVAQTNNAAGIAGIADQAFVLPLRALGRCGGYLSDIADAIRWAAGLSVSGIPANLNPADVINLSLGSTGSCTQTEQSAINAAVNAGVVVIAAAGNEGATKISAPANCSNVIAVAATTRDGAETCYTNIGRNVDISAPGGNSDQPSLGCTTTAADGIRLAGNDGTTTAGDDDYYSEIGTSFSTPMVAGAAALMKAVDDTLTPASIDAILKNTARIFPAAASDGFDDCNIARCGTGILDIQAAIAIAADPVTNDSIPDAFSLGNKTDVTPEDTVISNTIRISGINVPTPVIIHNGEYSIDSNPFTEEAGTISNDQTIRVRLTAAADFSETVKSVLMVGGHRSTFSVTTASMFSNDGGGGGGVSGGLSVLCAGMLLYRRRMDQALKIK